MSSSSKDEQMQSFQENEVSWKSESCSFVGLKNLFTAIFMFFFRTRNLRRDARSLHTNLTYPIFPILLQRDIEDHTSKVHWVLLTHRRSNAHCVTPCIIACFHCACLNALPPCWPAFACFLPVNRDEPWPKNNAVSAGVLQERTPLDWWIMLAEI